MLARIGPSGRAVGGIEADDAVAARVLREALDAGVEVVSFSPAGGSLEEIYLSMEGERR